MNFSLSLESIFVLFIRRAASLEQSFEYANVKQIIKNKFHLINKAQTSIYFRNLI